MKGDRMAANLLRGFKVEHQQPFQCRYTSFGMIAQKLQCQDIDRLPHIKHIVIIDSLCYWRFGSSINLGILRRGQRRRIDSAISSTRFAWKLEIDGCDGLGCWDLL